MPHADTPIRRHADTLTLSAQYPEEFFLRDERPLRSFQTASAIAKQVAFAYQVFPSRFVENDLGIHGGSYAETNLQGEVGLNKPGNDVSVWPLGRKHQVNTCSSALRRETYHKILEFFAQIPFAEHQVCKLIKNQQKKREIA